MNPRNHFTETGGRDVEPVAVSLLNHLRVTGHNLHARLMRGAGHRFDDLFKLRDFETFFEHEAGRDIERLRAAHRDVIHRTGNGEGSDVAAREEERTDHVSVAGNDRGALDFREERAVVPLIKNRVREVLAEHLSDQLCRCPAAGAVREINDPVLHVDRS